MNETIVKIQEEKCHLLFGKFWEVKGSCSVILDSWELSFYVVSVIGAVAIIIGVFVKYYLISKGLQKLSEKVNKETKQLKLEINNNQSAIKEKIDIKFKNISKTIERANNNLNFLSVIFKKIINFFRLIKIIFLKLFQILKFILCH